MPDDAAMLWSLERRDDLYTVIDGLEVRYWDVGEGSPVVLIHGLGGTVETWLPNVDALARRHRVLALDLPGFGRSGRQRLIYSPGSATGFVAGFLDHLGAGRASIVGNSMGGLVALQLAVDQPWRVERLVLVGSAGLGREVGRLLRLASVPWLGRYLLSRLTPEELVVGTVNSVVSNPQSIPRDLIERWIDITSQPGMLDSILQATRAGLTILGQRRRIVLRDRLAELRVPTLLIWGSEDPVIPVAHAYAAHRLLPGSQIHVFEGCRHCPQLERPVEFNELVLRFLSA